MSRIFTYGFTNYLEIVSSDYLKKLFGTTPINLEEHKSYLTSGDTVLCNCAEGNLKIIQQIEYLETLHCCIVFFSKNQLHSLFLERLKNIPNCNILMQFDVKNIQAFKEKYDRHEVFYSKKVEQYSLNKYKGYRKLEPLQQKILVYLFCNYTNKQIAQELNTTVSSVKTRVSTLKKHFSVNTNKELCEAVSLII